MRRWCMWRTCAGTSSPCTTKVCSLSLKAVALCFFAAQRALSATRPRHHHSRPAPSRRRRDLAGPPDAGASERSLRARRAALTGTAISPWRRSICRFKARHESPGWAMPSALPSRSSPGNCLWKNCTGDDFSRSEHALVWIDWRGPQPWRTLIHNGDEREIQSLTESEILLRDQREAGSNLTADWCCAAVSLGTRYSPDLPPRETASAQYVGGRRMQVAQPRNVLQAASSNASGWAIHEIVKWK